MKKISLEKI